MTFPTTTIIIPALNEAPVIGTVVRSLKSCQPLRESGITDILVVDNGSTDATTAEAQAAGARVIWEPRRGYGRACLSGINASPHAEIIVQMDGDGSDVPEDIMRVWQPIADGSADLVMGSRVRGHHEPDALTLQQIVGNAVGTALMRLLYGTRITDIGPLRAFRRDTLLAMDMQELTYGWSAEMLAKAGRLHLRIHEVPVDYRRRAGGESKVAGTLQGAVKASYIIMRTIGKYARWSPRHLPVDDKAQNALFIVARLPIEGQTKTRLARTISDQATVKLYTAFLRDIGERLTLTAEQHSFDLIWYYTGPADMNDADFAAYVPYTNSTASILRQPLGSFGERLWSGFSRLHESGYRKIIVLGSDSPHVPAATIIQAFDALDRHDVVIGPAKDGGYYLLGQRGQPADLFTSITMSTATVADETRALAAQLGLTVAEVPLSFDIDESSDLVSLAAVLKNAPSPEADPAPRTLLMLREIMAEVADARS
jgi:rSAM/selenodomain-associated transferase 1